ncbi:hypothetical protein RIR_jg34217.t1 [Rhizophagus irregularis DAOM 181602=DAOM 197198]|nr:hypothetical protein RIR_jg34217.t1 [Rhizophagus irregularis DAOM 181602=DAOM 197198]
MNYIYHNKAKFLDQLLLYNEIRSLLSNDESQNYPKSSLDDILDHKLNLSKIFDLKIEENYGISRIILYNTIQKDKNTIVMDVLEEPFRDEQNFNKFIRHIPNILQHINFTFLIHDINDKTSGKTAIVLLQNEKWHIVKFLEFLKSYGLSSGETEILLCIGICSVMPFLTEHSLIYVRKVKV